MLHFEHPGTTPKIARAKSFECLPPFSFLNLHILHSFSRLLSSCHSPSFLRWMWKRWVKDTRRDKVRQQAFIKLCVWGCVCDLPLSAHHYYQPAHLPFISSCVYFSPIPPQKVISAVVLTHSLVIISLSLPLLQHRPHSYLLFTQYGFMTKCLLN